MSLATLFAKYLFQIKKFVVSKDQNICNAALLKQMNKYPFFRHFLMNFLKTKSFQN